MFAEGFRLLSTPPWDLLQKRRVDRWHLTPYHLSGGAGRGSKGDGAQSESPHGATLLQDTKRLETSPKLPNPQRQTDREKDRQTDRQTDKERGHTCGTLLADELSFRGYGEADALQMESTTALPLTQE